MNRGVNHRGGLKAAWILPCFFVTLILMLVQPGYCADPSRTSPATPAASSPAFTPGKVPTEEEVSTVKDKFRDEMDAYRKNVSQLFADSDFDALDALADKARTTKARFPANGEWQIMEFYLAMDCRKKDPESTWQLHDDTLKKWVAAKPQSVTALMAQASFLTKYAWRARGDDYGDKVTADGWRLFRERLERAQSALTLAEGLKQKCPMWWRNQMVVALGMDWDRGKFEKLYAEAKAFDPDFIAYDIRLAQYLMPRWHGEPGDWEAAAEREISRPGLGLEGYARVVMEQVGYYENIFRDSKASWPKTRDGLEEMRRKYPEWHGLANMYALLACLAGDRPTAQKLFTEIGLQIELGAWYSKWNFIRYWKWAHDDKNTETIEYHRGN